MKYSGKLFLGIAVWLIIERDHFATLGVRLGNGKSSISYVMNPSETTLSTLSLLSGSKASTPFTDHSNRLTW